MTQDTAMFPPRIIKASAGTGKTFQLSNRFIALLSAGEDPEKILATTFTRKAAGEIQARVFERIVRAVVDEACARELAEQIATPAFAREQALEILRRLVKKQHRLAICTLDSFCIRIARSIGLELGFLPDWQIMSEQEKNKLHGKAIRKLCEALGPEELGKLMQGVGKGTPARSVHNKLEKDIAELHELSVETEDSA